MENSIILEKMKVFLLVFILYLTIIKNTPLNIHDRTNDHFRSIIYRCSTGWCPNNPILNGKHPKLEMGLIHLTYSHPSLDTQHSAVPVVPTWSLPWLHATAQHQKRTASCIILLGISECEVWTLPSFVVVFGDGDSLHCPSYPKLLDSRNLPTLASQVAGTTGAPG
jgi:hypothetical protein